MPVDECLKRRQQIVTGKIEAAHDLARDIFRGIFGPTLGGVERNDANWVAVLPGHQIGNDAFQIGPLGISLTVGAAQPSEVIKNEIDGLIVAV